MCSPISFRIYSLLPGRKWEHLSFQQLLKMRYELAELRSDGDLWLNHRRWALEHSCQTYGRTERDSHSPVLSLRFYPLRPDEDILSTRQTLRSLSVWLYMDRTDSQRDRARAGLLLQGSQDIRDGRRWWFSLQAGPDSESDFESESESESGSWTTAQICVIISLPVELTPFSRRPHRGAFHSAAGIKDDLMVRGRNVQSADS